MSRGSPIYRVGGFSVGICVTLSVTFAREAIRTDGRKFKSRVVVSEFQVWGGRKTEDRPPTAKTNSISFFFITTAKLNFPLLSRALSLYIFTSNNWTNCNINAIVSCVSIRYLNTKNFNSQFSLKIPLVPLSFVPKPRGVERERVTVQTSSFCSDYFRTLKLLLLNRKCFIIQIYLEFL